MQVYSCAVLRDPGSGLNRGYGFIKFKSKEIAQKAMTKLNDTEMKDHPGMKVPTSSPCVTRLSCSSALRRSCWLPPGLSRRWLVAQQQQQIYGRILCSRPYTLLISSGMFVFYAAALSCLFGLRLVELPKRSLGRSELSWMSHRWSREGTARRECTLLSAHSPEPPFP